MVKVNLVSMNTHISSVKDMSGQRIASLQQVISSLDQFYSAGSLQGQAYTNAKDFGQDVLRSLAQGLILYSEELSQSASQLGSLYKSIVGDESLDESVLRANIASYQASLAHQSYIYNRLMGEDILNFRSLNSLHSAMSITNNSLQKEQEKLDRLLTFNSQSASVFSDLDRLKQSITSGFSEVRSSFGQHASQGGFSIPDKMAWKKDLDDRWKERTEAIRSGYDAVVKKVEKGEELTEEDIRVINRYVHENPHLTLAPSIQKATEVYEIIRKYEEVVKKLENGGELSKEDIASIEDFIQERPDYLLDSIVSNALMVHEVGGASSYAKGASYLSTGSLAGTEALASIKKIKNGTWWRKPVSTTYSKTGYKTWRQVSGEVSRFKNVKVARSADELINGAGKIVKGGGAKGALKSVGTLGGALAIFDGVTTYFDRVDQYGTVNATVDGVAHTATAVGSIYVGAAIGSLIPIPVVGTIAGAVAGYVFGGIVNTLYDGLVRNDWDGDNWALW
ncbi:T7SS effector LXG polymorphic toxin [Streptococcus suis]|uniref:T7SS effector LXG polymorphic toxin n=1 Tax=Streptococcus suis TaxID=1307 RepID=UPI0014796A6B|nr:T7SS effector LXG polymorphic toxin [Streptococcus suis]